MGATTQSLREIGKRQMAISEHLRGHGTPINVENWRRYAASPEFRATFELILDKTRQLSVHPGSEHIITRGDVADLLHQSPKDGVHATMVWGYPRGRFPGGRGFSRIFDNAERLGELLTKARTERLPAGRICEVFSSFADPGGERIGMGPSTFTKLLYFAGVVAEEGRCLIYDQRVMRSIVGNALQLPDEIWRETRQLLGPPVRLIPRVRHCASYGPFLSAATEHARRHGMTSDAVELWLFQNGPGRQPAYVAVDP
jgi:hypothetical protein